MQSRNLAKHHESKQIFGDKQTTLGVNKSSVAKFLQGQSGTGGGGWNCNPNILSDSAAPKAYLLVDRHEHHVPCLLHPGLQQNPLSRLQELPIGVDAE